MLRSQGSLDLRTQHQRLPVAPTDPKRATAPGLASRITIPTKIFAAITALLAAFLIASIPSVIAHQRSAEMLRLLHEGYLPLALTLGSAKADHAIYGSMLDRMLAEPDSSRTQEWVDRAVRQVMPATIGRALEQVARADALDPGGEDAIILRELDELLREVQRGYADTEPLDRYFLALTRGDRSDAQAALETLRRRDRRLTGDLRHSVDEVQERVREISAVAAMEQSRSMWIAAVMTCFGFLFGVAVLIWARRLLAPLPRLEARVLEVARGDLRTVSGIVPANRTDEIGRLAIELERMVEALAARDQQLRDAADKLVRSERLAVMGRMAAHVTHEVRNPLNSIHLNAELLEDELTHEHAETKAILASIRREVDRLGLITEEYLKLARLPSPKLEAEDLSQLTREVLRFVQREMREAHIEVHERLEKTSLVQADESQIRQTLMNLLRNAREAMPQGGVIDVEVVQEAEGVVIRIADRGPGIPEEVRMKMFDAFYSTKERGTGLGLPLTQQIILAHRGQIRCEDREGGGAVFVLVFPIFEEAKTA
jgi:signal transduction histidine kinase